MQYKVLIFLEKKCDFSLSRGPRRGGAGPCGRKIVEKRSGVEQEPLFFVPLENLKPKLTFQP